jgi:hypothetical protein
MQQGRFDFAGQPLIGSHSEGLPVTKFHRTLPLAVVLDDGGGVEEPLKNFAMSGARGRNVYVIDVHAYTSRGDRRLRGPHCRQQEGEQFICRPGTPGSDAAGAEDRRGGQSLEDDGAREPMGKTAGNGSR